MLVINNNLKVETLNIYEGKMFLLDLNGKCKTRCTTVGCCKFYEQRNNQINFFILISRPGKISYCKF